MIDEVVTDPAVLAEMEMIFAAADTQWTNDHFAMLPLNHGKFAIIDEMDVQQVKDYGNWCAVKSKGRTWYAQFTGGGYPQSNLGMHNLIMGQLWVDHINRNGLDNRRVNLRPVTPSQNAANQGLRANNKSGYKGVYWDSRYGKWRVKIMVRGHLIQLGKFDDPVDAARTYNQAALEAFGEYAWLNPL